MQGLFIDNRRPTSKKEVKAVLADAPARVRVEATSLFGNDFDGRATDLPIGQSVTFVGPDPHTSRKFYGVLVRQPHGFVIK